MLAQILTSATVIIMQITDLKPFRPCQKSSKRVDISSAFNSNPSDSYWPTTNPSFQCVWIFSERFLKSEIELILQTWARSQDFYESRATLSRWKPTHVFGMIKIYCVQQKKPVVVGSSHSWQISNLMVLTQKNMFFFICFFYAVIVVTEFWQWLPLNRFNQRCLRHWWRDLWCFKEVASAKWKLDCE